MDRAVFPLCYLTWGQTIMEVIKIMLYYCSAFLMIIRVFFFNLLIWIILTDFRILNQSYIFELNKTWSRYIIPSIYCWIHFVKLLKFLACAVFMRNTVEVFFSRNIFTWFWHQDEDSLLECVKKCSLLLIFPECLM